ncbi:MAG TPA: restriction endonuclease subunit S [Bacteroidia bacterium]|jgi:type I restriction enzyme S subunit|nr:restriction endonuclease subunit S [Bacteroidia bacterium]
MAIQKKNSFNGSTSVPKGWELKLLGELGTFSKGNGITKEQLSPSGLPCIRYGEIYTSHDYFIKQFRSFISDEVAKDSRQIRKNDILLAGSGETLEDIGKAIAYIGNEEAYAGGDVIIFSPNGKTDSIFLSYFLNTNYSNRQKRRLGQGHSVVHIYPYMLEELKIFLPPLSEQKKIRDILFTWNKAIELTGKLIEAKEKQKDKLLQNIFINPKQKQKNKFLKLGNECEVITKGTTPTTNGFSFLKSGINFIKIETIQEDGTIIKDKLAYISEEAHISLKRSQLKENDILISIAGALGRVTIIKKSMLPANTNQALGIIRINPKGKLNYAFVYYFLQSPIIKKRIKEINVQAAQANLSLADLNSFLIPELTADAQENISSVFLCCDNEISLLKRKLNILINQKKGLMQYLFTGEKRVKI